MGFFLHPHSAWQVPRGRKGGGAAGEQVEHVLAAGQAHQHLEHMSIRASKYTALIWHQREVTTIGHDVTHPSAIRPNLRGGVGCCGEGRRHLGRGVAPHAGSSLHNKRHLCGTPSC